MLHYSEGNIWFDSHTGYHIIDQVIFSSLCLLRNVRKFCTFCACFLYEKTWLFSFSCLPFLFILIMDTDPLVLNLFLSITCVFCMNDIVPVKYNIDCWNDTEEYKSSSERVFWHETYHLACKLWIIAYTWTWSHTFHECLCRCCHWTQVCKMM